MAASTSTKPSLPADVTRLGRGKAQKFILSTLHAIEGGRQALHLSDLAHSYSGHFAGLMSAGQALAKRGLISIAPSDLGDVYTLVPHTH